MDTMKYKRCSECNDLRWIKRLGKAKHASGEVVFVCKDCAIKALQNYVYGFRDLKPGVGW